MANLSRPSSTQDLPTDDLEKRSVDDTHVEHVSTPVMGLTEEEAGFVRNFPEERRKKLLRKVSQLSVNSCFKLLMDLSRLTGDWSLTSAFSIFWDTSIAQISVCLHMDHHCDLLKRANREYTLTFTQLMPRSRACLTI